MTFERVYTVWDYCDGPRTGLADFNGRPHYYSCERDAGKEKHTQTFRLSPVDHETTEMALEQWTIWREWELTFHTGSVAPQTHPALGDNNERYDLLDQSLERKLQELIPLPQPIRGEFTPVDKADDTPQGVMRELEVEWWNDV